MAQVSTFSATTWDEERTVTESGVKTTEVIHHVNDISLSGGQIAMARGKDAYRTVIECAIRTRLGELPLDSGQGIPYFETVFDSSRKIGDFENALRARIEELDFVDGVESLETSFDRERGVLSYTLKVTTADGEAITATGSAGV